MGVYCPSREPTRGEKRWRHSGDHSIAIRAPERFGEYHLPHRHPAGCQAGPCRPDSLNVSLLPSRPCRDRSALQAPECGSISSAERKCVSGMTYCKRQIRTSWFVLGPLAAVLACGGNDQFSPSVEAPSTAIPATTDSAGVLPTDSAAVPTDSTLLPPDTSAGTITVSTLAAGTQPGIVFGSYGMPASALNSVHTGTHLGGPVSESNVLSILSAVRAKGGRMVLKMCMGADKYVKNADGTFSLSKWKSLVDRYKKVNLGPYISDGTLMGHFLIDEPQRAAKWGGKIISQATVEAMAQYSKAIWPTLPTLARVAPTWLASSPVTYRALDAGWLQYTSNKGDPAKLLATETSAAKSKSLGLIVGLNILDGGNGSSGVRGWSSSDWAMTATEIRKYGTVMLSQAYACGFFNWTYDYFGATYYARSDIKSAMTELSSKAKAHVRTSCRQ